VVGDSCSTRIIIVYNFIDVFNATMLSYYYIFVYSSLPENS